MADIELMKIPDMGGAENVDVIEVLVKEGDHVVPDQALITLESDKATMEVPATKAGVVKKVVAKVGDKVSEGSVILELGADTGSSEEKAPQVPAEQPAPVAAATSEQAVTIPDLGGASEVTVIEVLAAVGDEIAVDQPLVTLESDKATMEVPSPYAGQLSALLVKVGDKVREQDAIANIATTAEVAAVATEKSAPAEVAVAPAVEQSAAPVAAPSTSSVYAGPAVRRIANELGVDLARVSGSGDKGRITKDDLKRFLAGNSGGSSAGGLAIPAMPAIDFSQFGPTETVELSKINRLTGEFMQRNWLTVPHVTQFEEADITEMEAFRQAHKKEALAQGVKLTPLVFIMKAAVKALQAYPRVNSSITPAADQLIQKNYFHIGVAVDTPNGLVVPVIRDVDQKTLYQLAEELAAISKKAREKGLSPSEMQGGCFTISSLGGIGGSAFTPIVNAPEAAILGVSKSQLKPIYQTDGSLAPRLMLPLSLSYDHRIIDGALGARFATFLAKCLTDIRTLLL